MGTVNINFPKTAGRAILAEAQFDKDAYMWSSDIECYVSKKPKNNFLFLIINI